MQVTFVITLVAFVAPTMAPTLVLRFLVLVLTPQAANVPFWGCFNSSGYPRFLDQLRLSYLHLWYAWVLCLRWGLYHTFCCNSFSHKGSSGFALAWLATLLLVLGAFLVQFIFATLDIGAFRIALPMSFLFTAAANGIFLTRVIGGWRS
jgi:hypothetical protein